MSARTPARLAARGAFCALGFIAFAVLAGGVATARSCALPYRTRIVLASDVVDPDVFVWDSRLRLVDYVAGEWGNVHQIFAHTLLAEPGTVAVVIACHPGVARPEYTSEHEDVIGLKIISGPFRGRYGWIVSSDMHLASAADPSRRAVRISHGH